MKKVNAYLGIVFSFLFVLQAYSFGVTVGGVYIPDTYHVDNQTLVLNGTGNVKKFIFIRIYVGALYVEKKTHDADDVYNQNLKVIRMHFTYSKIPAKKIKGAFKEDFERISKKFADSDIAKKFLNVFNFEVKKGDNVDLVCNKDKLTVVYNGKKLASFTSKELVDNIVDIYIGKHAAHSSLREDLLGK